MPMKNLGLSVIAVALLMAIAALAYVKGWQAIITIFPYVAFVIFLAGFIFRMVKWWLLPVPFRITTTCGQQKSLPWIKRSPLENPSGFWEVAGRMAMEIFFFRSLFRNSKAEIAEKKTVYGSAKWLWFFGLLFHWSFLIIVLRHLRFFVEPITPWIGNLSAIDGFFEIGIPALYLSDLAMLAGLTFLFFRRVIISRMRYISLAVDYFALLLIAGIVVTGLLMRHFYPTDLFYIKSLVLGWFTFSPAAPANTGIFLYIHLCLVLVLFAWFPFSKLMHMGGVFLSPTRMMANSNRAERHVNPWNAPVKVHTYEEYEDEFRDKMKAAGLPVDKE